MGQLNDLLVLGKATIKGSIKANNDHDLICHSNEFTFASPGYSGDIYVNYRTASGSTDGAITGYRFYKGDGTNLANIIAAGYSGTSISGTSLSIINDASNTSNDALAYFRCRSNNDWTVKVDSEGYEYGLLVTNAHTATHALQVTGASRFSNTLRIGNGTNALDGNYCEGIRIRAADGQWATIIMGATADTGTNTNAWSIHRKSDNNFCISKNSSDGVNGLVMTSTGMGLGTASPSYRLHVVGDIYANGGWVRVSGNSGFYCESYGGGWHMTDGTYLRSYNGKMVYASGRYLSETVPSSWLDGLKNNHGAYNVNDYSNDSSYNPWMRAKNTHANVKKYFSFGTLGKQFYWVGSTTDRTENGYDKGMSFNVESGLLYAPIVNGDRIYTGYDSGVTNSVSCSNWFRSSGATGWYNATYAGGWYMSDELYVRSHNSKSVLIGNSLYIGTNAGAGTGIALYATSLPNNYGIHMSLTSGYGTYGQVSADWATYFCFDGAVNRGWIFKHANTNVFSINGNGTLSIRENIPGIFFRPGHATYDANIAYQTSGNEALMFTTKAAVTSFMFVNGEDTITNNAADRWTKVTPGLQIKNNCVSIGALIPSGTTPGYKLEVSGGISKFNGVVFGYNYTNNNNAAAFIWDKPGSYYTGVGCNGTDSTIQFGACNADGTWANHTQTWLFKGKLNTEGAITAQGALNLQNKNLTTGTFPTSSAGRYINWTDVNGNVISRLYGYISSSSYNALRLYAYKPGTTDTSAYLYIQYGETADSANTKAGSSVKFYGAVWNDYAEFRKFKGEGKIPYGHIVTENGDDSLSLTTQRMQKGCNVCSDTFGFAIGETEENKMPIAVAGRSLVYTYEDRYSYLPGDAVCSAPGGTVSKMTRQEIKDYPDCIIGYVSAIPDYEIWGKENTVVDGRIWIKVV